MNKKWYIRYIVASVCKTKVLAKQREFLIIFLHNTLQDKISRKIHRLSLVQLTIAKYINGRSSPTFNENKYHVYYMKILTISQRTRIY